MPTPEVEQLRSRARRLRLLGHALARRPLADVVRRAGVDTWHGPLAERWRDEVVAAQHRLDAAGDDLTVQAIRLERRADELELRATTSATPAMTTSGTTGGAP